MVRALGKTAGHRTVTVRVLEEAPFDRDDFMTQAEGFYGLLDEVPCAVNGVRRFLGESTQQVARPTGSDIVDPILIDKLIEPPRSQS